MFAMENASRGNAISRMGQVVGAEPSGRDVEAPRPTLHRAIDNAHRVGNRLDEHGERLTAMADVAEQLANRLGGSYPTEGPNKALGGTAGDRGPMSTVEAVNSAIDSLHPHITGFENPMSRIVRALEMIEQANG